MVHLMWIRVMSQLSKLVKCEIRVNPNVSEDFGGPCAHRGSLIVMGLQGKVSGCLCVRADSSYRSCCIFSILL